MLFKLRNKNKAIYEEFDKRVHCYPSTMHDLVVDSNICTA